jgi:DNA-binding MarR family transcriptional regulator
MAKQPKAQQYKKYQNLEEQMQIIKSFFSQYFRKTMTAATLDDSPDFSLTELKALSAFSEADGEYSISDLSSNSYIPLSNMTPIIKRLEKRGIVNKYRDARDERYVRVCLTDEGKELLNKFMKKRMHEIEHIIGQLSQKNQKELFGALEKAASILKALK